MKENIKMALRGDKINGLVFKLNSIWTKFGNLENFIKLSFGVIT